MDLHSNVTEFFREAVTEALKTRDVAASEPTEFYLVNLLTQFLNVNQLDQEPVALKLVAAKEAQTPDARAKTLREIGDTTLYLSGFFSESLTRRTVDLDYYISMGGAAYGQLATMVGSTRTTGPEFFRAAYLELSRKFAEFVAVLTAVRDAMGIPRSSNLIRMCEEWVRTGNDALERRLRESGVVALPTRGGRNN